MQHMNSQNSLKHYPKTFKTIKNDGEEGIISYRCYESHHTINLAWRQLFYASYRDKFDTF